MSRFQPPIRDISCPKYKFKRYNPNQATFWHGRHKDKQNLSYYPQFSLQSFADHEKRQVNQMEQLELEILSQCMNYGYTFVGLYAPLEKIFNNFNRMELKKASRNSLRSKRGNEKVQEEVYFEEHKSTNSKAGLAGLESGQLRRKKKNSRENGYRKIQQIPTLQLTKEDMKKDPISIINQLESIYVEYGAVKLQTPPEWDPPFCLKYSENLISTRIQSLHHLKMENHLLFPIFSIIQPFERRDNSYNIQGFSEFARGFEKKYIYRTNPVGLTQQDKNQMEYWNLVKANVHTPAGAHLKTRIQYAADLPVSHFGSGFPLNSSPKSKDDHFDYANSWFNLNRIYKAPKSLSKITQKRGESISGITTPWVYMGMMFSTFCWHVEDLGINSINYSHKGATKTWYVVPQKDKQKFDEYVREKTGKSNLLERITYMLDPLELLENGIQVYKANQRPGQYICTFFNAYHGGFSHGFNIGEAVNFVSVEKLNAVRSLFENSKKPEVMSYQWLVHENMEAEIEQRAVSAQMKSHYKAMIKKEYESLKQLIKQYEIREGKMLPSSYKYFKNSCCKCRNYQYLSSIACADCGNNYCFKDVRVCCNGKYRLNYREPNQDRKRLLTLLNKQ